MLREIKTLKDPVLRRPAKKIEKVTPEIRKLIDDMFETMHAANGLGLAAPQVGVSQRIFVVEIEKDERIPGSGIAYALINPEIVKASEERDSGPEGCLSIPGWRGEVERASKVLVRALDRDGKRIRVEVEGLAARAMQHELDHLDGVLFIDKLTAPDRIWRIKEDDDSPVE
jgi:peptide deformylase